MAVRESINRIRIERARMSRVPIDATETIYQGDMLVWDVANRRATKATAASAGTFIGLSETKNPIETAGSPSLLSDQTLPRVNVIQQALVDMIASGSETLYPWDALTVGADAQIVVKAGATAANTVARVDPGWASSSGKAVVAGDIVRCWITVRPEYNHIGGAAATLA